LLAIGGNRKTALVLYAMAEMTSNDFL
jgi:hypothetical protein